MSELPPVKVLEAIKPSNAGRGEQTLAYDDLSKAVEKYKKTHHARFLKFWDESEGSLNEISSGRNLASEYLLRTSEKLINSNEENRDLWAERFTNASIELYGAPDSKVAAELLSQEYNQLTDISTKSGLRVEQIDFLKRFYEPILEGHHVDKSETEDTKEKQAINQYGEAINAKYGYILNLVDQLEKDILEPDDLQALFENALHELAEKDDADWSKWKVEKVEGTSLSVSASIRKIKIADRREPATKQEAKKLLAHELLVHALRAKNGYKTGEKKLATGLANYIDAEEGLGVLSEEAISGELPYKVIDRYIDIALALGVIDGKPKSRNDLFKINFSRQVIRAYRENDDNINYIAIEHSAWRHVDRIFRGGLGDKSEHKQGIFTKDVAYYVGYKQMKDYVTKQLEDGKSADEVLSYLTSAKFDPNNPAHVEVLKSHNII